MTVLYSDFGREYERPVRRIGKAEAEADGRPLVTESEFRTEIARARLAGNHRRAYLLTRTAIRWFERRQAEARKT